jgi:hypothetical protein
LVVFIKSMDYVVTMSIDMPSGEATNVNTTPSYPVIRGAAILGLPRQHQAAPTSPVSSTKQRIYLQAAAQMLVVDIPNRELEEKVHLPQLEVVPAHIVKATLGRIVSMTIYPTNTLRGSFCHQVLPRERWTNDPAPETVPPALPMPPDLHSQVAVYDHQSVGNNHDDVLGGLYTAAATLQGPAGQVQK